MNDLSKYSKFEFSLEEFERDFLPSVLNTEISVLLYQDGELSSANTAFLKEFGYRDDNLNSVHAALWRNAHDRGRFLRHIQIVSDGKKYENEYYWLTKSDGQEIQAKIQVGRIVIKEKGVCCCCWLLTGAVSSLLEKVQDGDENIFKVVLDKSLNAIVLGDENLRLIYANEAFSTISGYTFEEGATVPILSIIAPESLPDLIERWKGWMEDRPLPPSNFLKIVRKDGEKRDVEIMSHTIYAKGKKYRLNSIIDITDKVRAEQALRQSEKRHRTLIETIPDIIAEIDPKNNLTWLNEEGLKFFGSNATDKLLFDFISKEDEISPMRGVFERLFNGLEQIDKISVSFNRADGVSRTLSWICKPLRDDRGMIISMLCTVRDITEQIDQEKEKRNLEEQLNVSKKLEAVGRLAGGVAHDFNNMLAVILNYSTVILESTPPIEPLYDDIKEIKNAAERAAALTRQLLAFSRKQMLQPKIINLNTIIEDMGRLLRPLIGENIDLRIFLSNTLGQIKADPGQIEQVIVNLAVNARDAMPHGGKLSIETNNTYLDNDFVAQHIGAKAGHYVLLTIKDNGVGMDIETKSHIFEPFFTTKEKGKGTGLGLPTIYGIVKQSDGYIWVDSEPEKGTTFKIYLPRFDEKINDVEPNKSAAKHFSGSETILLVEDEPSLRAVVMRILKEHGLNVLLAQSGEEALALSNNHSGRIHLMLTDVVMPGMSGRELAEKLVPLRPDMKVIYMSGYTDDAIIHHGVLDSGIPFIEKPFTPQSLVQKIRDVLGE